MEVVQAAGRNVLGEFAPKFAELNDDVLFGETWNRVDRLSLKMRSIITVVSLMSQGITDTSFLHHLQNAKNNGVTKEEIAEIITHNAFYAGWPKAWAPFGERRGGIFTISELKEIGDRYHKTPAQVILRWHIKRGVVVIPKSAHKERMKENFNVFDFELTEEDMNTINSLDKNTSSFFCHQDPNMVE